jgi:hypothetical protein
MFEDQRKVHACFAELGIPLNPKDSQLGSLVKILGFEVDSKALTISIPSEKRKEMRQIISGMLVKGGCSLADLESINVKLVFVYCSRIWRLVSVLTKRRKSSQNFDGFAADASHKGGACVSPKLFSWFRWCFCCVELNGGNTEVLELAAILVGICTMFGSLLSASRAIWLTDSSAAVSDNSDGYAKNALTSELIAEIRFELIRKQVNDFRLVHTSRRNLTEVDSITRGDPNDVLMFLDRQANHGRIYVKAITPRSMNRKPDGSFCFKLHE